MFQTLNPDLTQNLQILNLRAFPVGNQNQIEMPCFCILKTRASYLFYRIREMDPSLLLKYSHVKTREH